MDLGTILQYRQHLDTCSSTNEVLLNMLHAPLGRAELPGMYVTTGYQTHGKGHGRNKWHSSPGKNILMSMLAIPSSIPADAQFNISRLVSLSLVDFLRQLLPEGVDVKIKWPNDIYADDGKIAGILIENRIMGASIRSSIIGIGINVNEDVFPDDIPNTVSLKQLLGKETDLEKALSLLNETMLRRNREPGHPPEILHEEYDNMLYALHSKRGFATAKGSFEGCIQGTDLSGMLIIGTPDGEKKFGFKEVSLLSM